MDAYNLGLPPLPFQSPQLGGGGQLPNPWFTVANQFIPRNLHDIIRWARYIAVQSPTTSEVIRKFATYPITEFTYETSNEGTRKKYEEIVKSFKLKEGLQNIGFEFFTVGNVFISVYFPIHRQLVCPKCGMAHSAKKANFVSFKRFQYEGTCPNCNFIGVFKRQDTKSLAIQDMNLVKWNPEHIHVNHNPITGESEYYYKIPNQVKLKVQKGDRLFVDTIPWGFIEAVKNNQDFKFDSNNIFHLQNLSTGGSVDGVAVPPLLSLFSLVFYQAVLRKANEAIATDYLNPLRVVFPQAQTANGDPVIAMSIRTFRATMEDALIRHKRDKNQILIAPTPVGYTPIGGEGKNLLVSQEIQQAEESILLSLGVSRELLSGLTNWTSSSVGLRMMENTLMNYTSRLQDLLEWIFSRVASYLNIELISVKLQPFKLLDDDTLKNILAQLVQAGGVSMTTFYQELGMDYHEELEKTKKEAVAKAKAEIETKFEVEQAEFVASKGAGELMQKNEEYQTLLGKAQQIAEQLLALDDNTRRQFMNQLKVTDYAMYIMSGRIVDEALGVVPQQGLMPDPTEEPDPGQGLSTQENDNNKSGPKKPKSTEPPKGPKDE